MRFRCIFTLYRLHHRRRSGFSFLHLDGQVTQHGIIEFEGGFQLDQGLVVAFDVQADVVRFSQFLDRVSHLTTAPIFNTVDVTATARYGCFVTFDHGRHLLALVRVDDKYYFIVTHANSLKDCEYAHPGVKTGVGRGKPATIAAFMTKSQPMRKLTTRAVRPHIGTPFRQRRLAISRTLCEPIYLTNIRRITKSLTDDTSESCLIFSTFTHRREHFSRTRRFTIQYADPEIETAFFRRTVQNILVEFGN